MGVWWLVLAGIKFVNIPTNTSDVTIKISSQETKVEIEAIEIDVKVDGCPRGGPMNKILTNEGNIRTVVFRLIKKGTRDPFDVSLATTVQLEVEEKAGVSFPPIIANPSDPAADFVNGVVVVSLGAPVSDKVGTYPYALTLIFAAETITADTGEIEVKERPGFPPP